MADIDRLSFISEWQDPFSSVNWKFTLFFYPADETIEMFDAIKHRLFLKRKKCESLQLKDLYVGAIVRICSRLIQITDYADSYTRSKVEPYSQKICGFLKPDVSRNNGQLLQTFIENDFRLINLRMIVLSEEDAYKLLKDHTHEAVLNLVVEHVTSGPVVAFHLLRADAFTTMSDLVGPEDSVEAKQKHPDTLRARFGADEIKNVLYFSNTSESAEKDFKILFHSKNYLSEYFGSALHGESVCCVIKPHAVRKGLSGAIIAKIEESGYRIVNMTMCTMNTAQAEKFLEIYKYVIAEFQEIVQELCSGSCIALEVKGETEENTFANFRSLVGPMDPKIGKCIRPNTIRAIFGETKIRNSVHVTDLIEDRAREIQYFFKRLS